MSTENKKCQKCGYRREEADSNAPDYACPKCGAVYAKVEAALRSKADSSTVPSRPGARTVGKVPPQYLDTDAQEDAAFARVLEGRISKGTKVAHIIYAGYLLGFLFPLLWVGFVIAAHVMRSPKNEGWLDEHFGWQIRTFWYGLVWSVAVGVLYVGLGPAMLRGMLMRDGLGLAGAVFGGWVFAGISAILMVWILYRIIRGWVFLFKAVPP